MSTNREVVSQVRTTHKLLSDASINDRTILAELKGNAKTLIKQYTDQRKLWNTPTIFTPIHCLEMQDVPLGECCEYSGDMVISRSKHRLPKILDGNNGLLIQGVFSINSSQKLRSTTLSRFLNYLALGLQPLYVFYWIEDGYLYISRRGVEVVKMLAYFEEDVPEYILNPDCDCAKNLKRDACKNPLDDDFKCPGTLEQTAIKMTSKTLLQTYFRISTDQTSDNKDDQTNKE